MINLILAANPPGHLIQGDGMNIQLIKGFQSGHPGNMMVKIQIGLVQIQSGREHRFINGVGTLKIIPEGMSIGYARDHGASVHVHRIVAAHQGFDLS